MLFPLRDFRQHPTGVDIAGIQLKRAPPGQGGGFRIAPAEIRPGAFDKASGLPLLIEPITANGYGDQKQESSEAAEDQLNNNALGSFGRTIQNGLRWRWQPNRQPA